jgi:MFS family permease
LLAVIGYLFKIGVLSAMTQTIAWSVIFFIASAAASSAYLTVSEIFPLEIRGLAIAIFYAFGTSAGAIARAIFGAIISTGSRTALFWAYCFAGAVMVVAAIVEAFLACIAHKSLEICERCRLRQQNPPATPDNSAAFWREEFEGRLFRFILLQSGS